jgi:hypothetical protein
MKMSVTKKYNEVRISATVNVLWIFGFYLTERHGGNRDNVRTVNARNILLTL